MKKIKDLVKIWRKLSGLPGGKWLFSRLIGYYIPYTNNIGALVDELSPGKALVTMRDRRHVRNHLNSVHAMALANLGEVVTGLALFSQVPDEFRGILVKFNITYSKKARRALTAKSTSMLSVKEFPAEVDVYGVIYDQNDFVVAEITSTWLLDSVH